MPVFDGAAYLDETLESLRAQTLADWELVAVDDCSRDASWEILQRHAARDPRIRPHRHERNRGHRAASNTAFALARGRYVARTDQDDLSLPRRLELQVDVPAGLAVRGDRALLGRVLQNLVGNAIKFTPDGGRVRVEAAIADDPRFVAVAVSDSGRGIPEEFRGRLFEKFASGSHAGRGSGLGLLFCRLAADAHGGRIRAEDNEPRGTRFVLTLPRIETP